jgi:hypothetical protein
VTPAATGGLHHVELCAPDLAGAVRPWGWLLGGVFAFLVYIQLDVSDI